MGTFAEQITINAPKDAVWNVLADIGSIHRLKFGLLGTLLDAVFVRSQYRKGMINLLKGLKQRVETQYAG
jgi:ligand-binding SRPBCC domain-containing protein